MLKFQKLSFYVDFLRRFSFLVISFKSVFRRKISRFIGEIFRYLSGVNYFRHFTKVRDEPDMKESVKAKDE